MRQKILLLSLMFSLIDNALADTTRAGDLPFYAAVSVSLSQTNGIAETDVPELSYLAGDPTQLPDQWPLNGTTFDDNNTAWAAAIGYQFTNYFAVELGYEELGTFQATARLISTPQTLPAPVTLDAGGLSLAAQFGYPLSERLRATWRLSVVRAQFDVEGDVTLGILVGPFPGPTSYVVVLPYADPEDETGYGLGFGLSWAFNKHFEVELAYNRQDLRVLDFDSVGLRFIGRL
jgi:opacity protein-like surface antigen